MKVAFCLLTSIAVLMPSYPITNWSLYTTEAKQTQKLNNYNYLIQDLVSNKENKTNIVSTDPNTSEIAYSNLISKPKIEKNSKTTDISLTTSLLQYEHLAVFIYNSCANTKLMSEPVSKIIDMHLKRHQDYRDILTNSIKKLQGKALKPNINYDLVTIQKSFGLSNLATEKDLLTLTAKIEEYGINTYSSSIAYIEHKETRKLAITIMSMAGRHSAMLHTLVGLEFIRYPKDIFNFSKPTQKPSDKDIEAINMLLNLENQALFIYEAVLATKLLAATGWKTATKFRDIHKENISKLQSLGIKVVIQNKPYDLLAIANNLGVNNLSREKDLMILLDRIEEQLCKTIMSTVENMSAKNYINTFVYISVTASQMNSIWDATLDRYKEISYL